MIRDNILNAAILFVVFTASLTAAFASYTGQLHAVYVALEHAARAYESAAKKAEELKDLWICLEAWRMASLSMERHKQKDAAWQYANQAYAVGREMTPEEREQSTLAFVGQAMLRISPNGQVKSEVKNAFDRMLGEEWLKQVEAATT